MRFIDLFAGLGGFHLALSRLGHECVFASEIQPKLQKLYKINFPDVPIYGDITKIKAEDIPPHEILCGGFPCQPFSFSGKKQGFEDELGRGNLFDEICRILRYHHPKYIFLENVSALPGHDGGRTWKVIRQKLDELGYDIRSHIYSPHDFGIPQHRPRFYIVGMLRNEQGVSGMHQFHFMRIKKDVISDVRTIVDMTDNDRVQAVRRDLHPVFDAWQEFVYNVTRRDGYMPSHCIFTMEFGADYEFEDTPPAFQPIERLRGRRGNYGQVLEGNTREELIAGLPFYMRKTKYEDTYPEFKKILIRQNRELYQRHKDWIDPWLEKISPSVFLSEKSNERKNEVYRKSRKRYISQRIRKRIDNRTPLFVIAVNSVGEQHVYHDPSRYKCNKHDHQNDALFDVLSLESGILTLFFSAHPEKDVSQNTSRNDRKL